MAITKDNKAFQEWLSLKKRIELGTALPSTETPQEKIKRIAFLKSNFAEFCKYYFPHYCKAEFAYFHLEAANHIIANQHAYAVLEWPREHAKSVILDVFITAFLYFKNEIKCAVLVSQTEDKASKLIGDIQAELEANRRLINDFGEHKGFGSWTDGSFITRTGVGFHAFGAGQSARGIRNAAERPNFLIVDDIDTNKRCKNEELTEEVVEWLKSDVIGACSINQSRIILAGNRIHQKSVLAQMVENIEPTDPINPAITFYSRVYAFEDANRQKSDHLNGKPAWHQFYKAQTLLKRFDLLGYRASRREFFHEHISGGKVFKPQQINWVNPLPLSSYDSLVSYCDPSYKNTKTSDFKAVVLVGIKGQTYHILDAWVRQASVADMVAVHYKIAYGLHCQSINCRHYIESNFIQDAHLNEYKRYAQGFGWTMPIRGDDRKKPDKFGRIEGISPYFEQGLVHFNEAKRQVKDFKTLIDQFLNFPTGHDDGPDAVEAAIFKLSLKTNSKGFKQPITGKLFKSKHRAL